MSTISKTLKKSHPTIGRPSSGSIDFICDRFKFNGTERALAAYLGKYQRTHKKPCSQPNATIARAINCCVSSLKNALNTLRSFSLMKEAQVVWAGRQRGRKARWLEIPSEIAKTTRKYRTKALAMMVFFGVKKIIDDVAQALAPKIRPNNCPQNKPKILEQKKQSQIEMEQARKDAAELAFAEKHGMTLEAVRAVFASLGDSNTGELQQHHDRRDDADDHDDDPDDAAERIWNGQGRRQVPDAPGDDSDDDQVDGEHDETVDAHGASPLK